MRAWCDAITHGLKQQAIDRDGLPYLMRYFAAGSNPWDRSTTNVAIYLHHFVSSDAIGLVHSHPWLWCESLILVGSYREYRCDAAGNQTVRDYHPGDVNTLDRRTKHRIELLTPDVWTLFLVGPYLQPWAFEADCGSNPGSLRGVT